MSDTPVVHLDVDEFWADPYPMLAGMRAETPICSVPELGATLLTKRDDCGGRDGPRLLGYRGRMNTAKVRTGLE